MKNFEKERIPKMIWWLAIMLSILIISFILYILAGFIHMGITGIPLRYLSNDLIGLLVSLLILLAICLPIYRRGINSSIQPKNKLKKKHPILEKVLGPIVFVILGLFFLWLGWQGVIGIFPWGYTSFNGLLGASLGIPLGILFLFAAVFNSLPDRLAHLGGQIIIGLTGLMLLLLFIFSTYFSIRYPSHMWDNIAGGNHYMSSGYMIIISLAWLILLFLAYRATLKIWGGKLTWREVEEENKKRDGKSGEEKNGKEEN